MEKSILVFLHGAKNEKELQSVYDHIALDLKLSTAQLNLVSNNTGENVFKKTVRFAILSLNKNGLIENTDRGVVKICSFLLKHFSTDQIKNIESIMEANYINKLVENQDSL